MKRDATYKALAKTPKASPVLVDMPDYAPPPGTALLRVATVGLCRTDLLVADGRIAIRHPVILGHEFSGWVEDLGAGTAPAWLSKGSLVAVDPTAPLPDGRDAYMGLDHQGCLATYACVPWAKLHDAFGMDAKVAAYLEPVACALSGAQTAAEVGGHGLIVGDNRITQLTAKTVMTMTASHRVSYEIATAQELREGIADGSRANRFDWIIETKATEQIFADAVAALKAKGSLIAKSRHADRLSVPIRDVVLRQVSLLGRSRCDFGDAMDWLKDQQDFVQGLLGAEFPLADWEAAFAHAQSSEDGKTFVSPALD